MIVLSEQNKNDRKKLTDLLIDNNIVFTQHKGQYEAFVKMRVCDPVEEFIANKLQTLQRELLKYIDANTIVKKRQKSRIFEQMKEWQQLQEIHQRTESFSDSLKAVFYVAFYNCFVQEQNQEHDSLLALYYQIFCKRGLQETSQKQKDLISQCIKIYATEQFQLKLNSIGLQNTQAIQPKTELKCLSTSPAQKNLQKSNLTESEISPKRTLRKTQKQEQNSVTTAMQFTFSPSAAKTRFQTEMTTKAPQTPTAVKRSYSPIKQWSISKSRVENPAMERLSTQQIMNYYHRLRKQIH